MLYVYTWPIISAFCSLLLCTYFVFYGHTEISKFWRYKYLRIIIFHLCVFSLQAYMHILGMQDWRILCNHHRLRLQCWRRRTNQTTDVDFNTKQWIADHSRAAVSANSSPALQARGGTHHWPQSKGLLSAYSCHIK